jgi:plastocyanin
MTTVRLLPIALVLGIFPAPPPVPAEPPEAANQAAPTPTARGSQVPGTATITGTVRYTSDRQRPWRLGRYYIRNARTGELAETVIALSRRGLKGPEPSRAPATVAVDQKDFQFTPETVAIRAGDRVKFLNHDSQVHNVQTFNIYQSFNVNMPSNGEHDETFALAGGIHRPYLITCSYHSAMRAWVFVFDHPWYQVTGKDGSFRLVNVPPGEYRLELVHAAGELQAVQTVAVNADETVAVDFRLSPADRREAK